MTGSGLAAQLSLSLEIIVQALGGQWGNSSHNTTDGQYGIGHTKRWACVRKRQSAKTLRATPEVVPGGPTIMSAMPRKPSSDKAAACGARQDSGRWSVRRTEYCL